MKVVAEVGPMNLPEVLWEISKAVNDPRQKIEVTCVPSAVPLFRIHHDPQAPGGLPGLACLRELEKKELVMKVYEI